MLLLTFFLSLSAYGKTIEPQLRNDRFQVFYDRTTREFSILNQKGEAVLKKAYLRDREGQVSSTDARYNSVEEIKKSENQLIVSFADRKMEVDLKLVITLSGENVDIETSARAADGEGPLNLAGLEVAAAAKVDAQVTAPATTQKASVTGAKLRFNACNQELSL